MRICSNLALLLVCLAVAACDVPIVETPDNYGATTGSETGDDTPDETGDETGTDDTADDDTSGEVCPETEVVPLAEAEWSVPLGDLGAPLYSMWAGSSDDLWITGGDDGEGSLLIQYDGCHWIRRGTGTTGDLWWAFGPSEKTVYFVGDAGTVLRYDRDSDTLEALSSPTDADLFGIWGTDEGNLYAVGGYISGIQPPVMLYIDGGSVTLATDLPAGIPDVARFFKVWGSGPDDVWAVGTDGLMIHWDGASWTAVPWADGPDFVTVHGRSSDDVVVVGGSSNGFLKELGATGWEDAATDLLLSKLWGTWVESDGSAFAVGDYGTVLERDVDGTWTQLELQPELSTHHLHAARVDDAGNLYAVGGALYTGDAGALACFGTTCPAGGALVSPEDLVADDTSGDDTVEDPPEPAWTEVLGNLSAPLHAIWRSSDTDIWVAGADDGEGPLLAHYDGSAWTQHATGTTGDLYSAFGPTDDSVYFVGQGGVILRWDSVDSELDLLPSPTDADLYAIWGADEQSLYAVGGSTDGSGPPALVFLDATSATLVSDLPAGLPDEALLLDVWGTVDGGIWVVGTHGAMIHQDGAIWTATSWFDEPHFGGIHGSAALDAVLVGSSDEGPLLKELGATAAWLDADLGSVTEPLHDAWVLEGGTAWAVGNGGTALARDAAGAWTQLETPDEYALHDWQAVTVDEAGNLFVVGRAPSEDALGVVGTLSCYGMSCPPAAELVPVDDGDDTGTDTPAAEPEWSVPIDALGAPLYSIWSSSPEDLWVTGGDDGDGSLLLQYDGIEWTRHDTGTSGDLWWGFGADEDTLYFVGDGGTILRYYRSVGAFEPLPSPTTADLFGVWGTDASNLYAVGGFIDGSGPPVLLTIQDGTATIVAELEDTLTEPGLLFKVWGSAADDVWAVGSDGLMLHWDGADWTQVIWVDQPDFVTVHGSGPDDVVAVGGTGSGVLKQFSSGTGWVDAATELSLAKLWGVWVLEGGPAYAVGNFGTVLSRDADGIWTPLEPPTEVLTRDWHAAHVDDADNLYIVGGALTTGEVGALACYGGSCAAGGDIPGPDGGDDPADPDPIAEPEPDAGLGDVMDDTGSDSSDAGDDDIGPELPTPPDAGDGPDALEVDVTVDAGEVPIDNEFPLSIGDGETPALFEEFTPFQEIEVIQGPQGGIHIQYNFLLETDYSLPQLFAMVEAYTYIDDVEVGETIIPALLVAGGDGVYASHVFFINFHEDTSDVYLGDPPQPTVALTCTKVTLTHSELVDPPDVAEVCEWLTLVDTVNEQE